MSLVRFPDWLDRLHSHFEAHRRAPIDWGTNDCALFTANGIKAMTGVDVAVWFRGRYTCCFTALREMRVFTDGGDMDDLTDKITAEFQIERWDSVLQARRGDVAIARTKLGAKLGIVWDGHVYSPGRKGLSRLSLGDHFRAWKI